MNPLLAPGNQYAPSLSGANIQYRSMPPPPPPSSPPTLNLEPAGPVPSIAASPSTSPKQQMYWFYRTETILEGSTHYWKPFDLNDSLTMEDALSAGRECVSVLGGRFDAVLQERTLRPVYWDKAVSETPIMRATWFYQGPASHWVPFPESVVPLLESHYAEGPWGAQKRISLGAELGHVMFHSKDIMFFTPALQTHQSAAEVNQWGQTQQDPSATPRIMHRGLEGLPPISSGEKKEIDHLIFVVHGVGKYCDMKLRDLIEVVSSMREKMGTLSEKHFQSAHLAGSASRVELLPISWHQTLHGEDTGTDARLKPLTLKSIPKLRTFMNDTLMDILFYTSPVFGQTIVDTVVNEINRVYQLFLKRNPSFKGSVSVMGHSLGSVILFDILSHQKNGETNVTEEKVELKTSEPGNNEEEQVKSLEELFEKLEIGSEYSDLFITEGIDLDSLRTFSADDLREVSLPDDAINKIMDYLKDPSKKESSKESVSTIEDYNKQAVKSDVQYVVGPAGTGQLSVDYPQLDFNPSGFYALGSPIALFLAIRGIASLGENFSFPTCPEFFNIFHPYDPVAYRMEAMVDPQYSGLRPITVPHHMGRKRMHLELKDTVTKLMTSDIRKKILEGVSYTLSSVYNMATGQSGTDELERTMEDEVLRKEELRRREDESNPKTMRSGLNGGNRIDFVLQEAPLESFNEYLFAIASHISYWDSEDVGLMILKNVYSKMNVRCDEELNVACGEMGSFVDSNIPVMSQPYAGQPFPPAHASTVPMMPPPPPSVPLMPVNYNGPPSQIYTPSIPTESSYTLPSMVPGPSLVQPKLYDPSSLQPTPPPLAPVGPPPMASVGPPPMASVGPPPMASVGPPPMSSVGPPPMASVGPPSMSLAGPPPMASAGHSPMSSAGPPPMSLAGPTPTLYDPTQGQTQLNPLPPSSISLARPTGYPKVLYPGVSPSNTPTTFPGHHQQYMGMDPTAPLNSNSAPIGPPPMGGFVAKK